MTEILTDKILQTIITIKGLYQEFTNYPTTVLNFQSEGKYSIQHKKKPLELMKYFIATYSDENDYVLDNTMG